ncbi:MAG: hypothetical protein K5705_15095 [Oscillospiraceae bacterium]|nr:hypothetical protein [Oscillospiraceae bacterium]MCR4761569.1 hypothetical protein [Oscillospiraceae bacterium]
MIDFNQIYKMAIDLINYTVSSRGFIEPNTTVCIILAKSGRVFNGVSHNEVHAEVEAVRNMQSFNENAVESLILVDANTRVALLPCINCIRYIISLNPVNTGAMVNMPDRPVPFQEVMAQNQAQAYASVHQSVNLVSATRSSMVMTGKSKSALLSGKVNGLLAATKEEEQTDEDIDLMNELADSVNNKKKGLFGGIFGKKEK